MQLLLGLRQASSVVQRQAAIVVQRSVERIPCNCLLVETDGVVETPESASEETGAVKRVGVPGIEREELLDFRVGTCPIPIVTREDVHHGRVRLDEFRIER